MADHEALEILQTAGQVTVLAEYMTQTRRIYLDEALPASAAVNPGYMGYSVGRWHGNTLEVQTIGVRDDVRYLVFLTARRIPCVRKGIAAAEPAAPG